MKIKIILISLILAATILTTACPKRTSIGDISANPSKYYNKDVAVAGTVRNSFGIALIGGIYKVDDGTGSIWILTNKSVPSKGTQIGVKGKIQDGVNYNGKNYGLAMIASKHDKLQLSNTIMLGI
jgi:hypothetical protein